MHLSDLQTKEIINLHDGKKLGKIIDVEINNNQIINLIIEKKRFFFNIFKKNDNMLVNWKMIKKIGEDVILVNNAENYKKDE